MWNLKYGTNEPIYETETDSGAQKTGVRLPRGRRVGREGRELGISRCKLLYIEWIGKKVLLYSTGSYIQYPVIHVSLNVTTYGILSESLATLLSSIK